MAPGIAHERGVALVREMLSEEFGRPPELSTKRLGIKKAWPDLAWKIASGFMVHDVLVVEVGNTTADKITRYLKSPRIWEVRWYTLEGILAGRWTRQSYPNNDFRMLRVRRRRARIDLEFKDLQEEKKKINHFRKLTSGILFALCPGCLLTFKIDFGKVRPWGSREILLCESCESPLSKTEIELKRLSITDGMTPAASTIHKQ